MPAGISCGIWTELLENGHITAYIGDEGLAGAEVRRIPGGIILPSGSELHEDGGKKIHYNPAKKTSLALRTASRVAILAAVLALLMPATGRAANAGMLSIWDNGSVSNGLIFPNWTKVWVGSYDVFLDLYGAGSSETLKSITLVNFGSATNADLKGVYWQGRCDVVAPVLQSMTYAGNYKSDSGTHPAWTWAGTSANFSGCADLCGKTACGAYFTIDIYVDMDDCPADGETLTLGFPTIGNMTGWTNWGSIWDNNGWDYQQPMYDVIGPEKTIVYVSKVSDQTIVAPGDTVTYTIYYGRPGSNPLSYITILDTQPNYTHYLDGTAAPPPDSGWDPNPGPPLKLRWTVPGPLAVAGGPTAMVTFSLSVDWGNGDKFESGSGNVAAPEGARLQNRAHATFGNSSCLPSAYTSEATDTAVRRFMMWIVGDNDVLFASSVGQPPDEMIYSIFIKNVSTTKTWWQVTMWDTVPSNINPWDADCGVEDPCVGWTMTPSGCAYASAGKVVTGTNTMLTWKLDMPPQMTLGLRWKAKVRSAAQPGDTATNLLNTLAYGHTGIVDGTGHSTTLKRFAHLAPIILPTTYISYCGYACAQSNCDSSVYFIPFFPLNRKTQFELRAIYYGGAGWSTTGGVSNPLGCLVGNCIGGFPGGNCAYGAGAIGGGGQAGCQAERIPARFDALTYAINTPIHHIYKVTSNSPVAWEILVGDPAVGIPNCGDNIMSAPSTTLTYTGLMHYMFRRRSAQNTNMGEQLIMMNTKKDPYGVVQDYLPTTVHMFRFDYGTLSWEYRKTFEIDHESVANDDTTFWGEEGPWRTISSDAQLIINQSVSDAYCNADGGCNCHNPSYFIPTRETGAQVSKPGSQANFYGVPEPWQNPDKVYIQNVGANAKYNIYRYIPIGLAGTSGRYVQMVANLDLPGGFAAPLNPAIFGTDGGYFTTSSTTPYKIELTSGGPIQVIMGARVFCAWASGGTIHAINGNQMGTEFWLPVGPSDASASCPTEHLQTVDIFCPKAGMAIRGQSEDGLYSFTYTTAVADQVVSFMGIAPPARKKNHKFTVLAGPNFGDVLAQYFFCGWERSYTAPFLVTGVHYVIVAPLTAYAGQSFWITVIVMDSTGTTKNDYVGTTSFTSSDPGAKIQGTGMDSYNYVWTGAEQGVKIFYLVTFTKTGLQSIVATDTLDGSISGLTSILIVAADVKLTKQKKLTVAASGDITQFQVCWENVSTATAFSFTITDAIPMGTSYYPELASAMMCWSTSPVPGVIVWYSTATSTTPPGTFTSVPGTSSPLSNTRWLRWTIRDVYMNSSGCVCYKVKVD